ncbi:TetR/AcrR family transcriptional regulator [Rhodococcus opacus]|uniref:TetR/AcrR family transcriptional regulator n=1 Tax=Rhodococcus opacus TaxID=37919 RepID=UPI0027DFCC6D|nr:TetR/AcrR family transcriptional regulator [Rhodococcus opacus]
MALERQTPRKRRADGEESRRRILDAAVAVATERGYEGTSIALVSGKCGLPASSIYWHFADKDDLIAAVIERSFDTWLCAWTVPDGDGPRERIMALGTQVAAALVDSPDFLRLGLMLTLEHRPVEARARETFLHVRQQAKRRIAATLREFGLGLPEESVALLTTYAMATAEGLFIAAEAGGDNVDLVALFELHARQLYDAAVRSNTSEGQ